MYEVPLWQTILGFVGLAVWGALCGLPALVLYSVAARGDRGAVAWILLILVFIVWFPLVTALCVWAVSTLIGVDLA